MIDVRKGRPADQHLEEIAALEALGVDWTISLSCGDDTGAAVETVQWFARDIIAPSRNWVGDLLEPGPAWLPERTSVVTVCARGRYKPSQRVDWSGPR